ncbi:MAG: carbon starvation protein A [Candidatus Sumerlaeia bacterium]|nr:carbon starvation protein A [Candidatus Sumerlaeia bacterium]
MNVLWFLIPAIVLLVLASRTYGVHLEKVFGADDRRPTPAARHDDNRDLVHTRVDVVFAHHFAAIAGSGPIIGPVFALAFGYLPVWMWLLIGGVFLGAVHDFGSLFVSVREGAKSIPTIARKTLGKAGYVLMILFFLSMIVLVTSVFLNLSAAALTSKYPLDKLRLPPDQTLLRTVSETAPDGTTVVRGVIGGIASTGVFVITLLAIPLGYIQRHKILKMRWVHLLGTAICVVSIVVGFWKPVSLSPDVWKIVLTVYTLVAAGVPLWLILQPRDVINVQILYGGILLLFGSLLVGGATHQLILPAPELSNALGAEKIGMIWPFLFITVACGAISGFHCMVSGGTTSRQLARESDIRRVAYNSMLLESLLAICVLLTLGSCLAREEYLRIVWPSAEQVQAGNRANPVFAFALAAGTLFQQAFGIPLAIGCVLGILTVEGFIVTTLDTAVRLNRYLFEELWDVIFGHRVPPLLKHYWFNATLSAALMLWFATGIKLDLGWLLFGTANQLVSALALIVITVWLMAHGRRFIYTLVPMVLMLVTTLTALMMEIFGTHPVGQTKNALYQGSAIFMAVMAFGVVAVVIRTIVFRRTPAVPPGDEAPTPLEAAGEKEELEVEGI